VHHVPLPQAISPLAANSIENYSLPEKRREYLPRLRQPYLRRNGSGGVEEVREQYSNGRRGDFPIAEDGSFSFDLSLGDGPGVYTVVVWVRKQGEEEPIAASNVSIRVEEPAQVSYSSR